MNKRIKKLIIGLCVLIVICVAYIVVIQNSSNSDDETDTDTDSQTATSLTAIKSSDITALSFNNISLVKSDDVWVYENDNDYPVDNDIADSLADTISSLTYTDSINKNDIDDLSIYGFEGLSDEISSDASSSQTSAFAITYTADNTSHVIYVGSYNSIIGGYYLTLDSDENIYVVETNLSSAFSYDSIYDILTADTIPETDASYMTGMAVVTPEASKIYSYEIISTSDEATDTESSEDSDVSGSETEVSDSENTTVSDASSENADVSDSETADASSSGSENTTASDANSENADGADTETDAADSDDDTSSIIWYVQTEDIASGAVSEKTAVDTDTFASAVDSILTATTDSVAAYKPSDEELTTYGLIIPAYTIIITYIDPDNETEQNTLTITLGNTDENGSTYAVINDSSMVITLSGIDLSGLTE